MVGKMRQESSAYIRAGKLVQGGSFLIRYFLFIITISLPLSGIDKLQNLVECRVRAYSEDKDPKGTNIRRSPAGKVLTTIPDGTMFFITGYTDGWFRIQGVNYPVENSKEVEARGHKDIDGWVNMPDLIGWIHVNLVSVNFETPKGIELFDSMDTDAKIIFRQPRPDKYKLEKIYQCNGRQLKVRINGKNGWIRSYCGNSLTTCP